MTRNDLYAHDLQEEEIHLRDYWQVIVKRKTTVFTFLAITFFTVLIATYTATPYYTASSQVLIERNESGGIDGRSYYRWDPDFLTTQFELIRSANVAHNVVKALDLDTKYRRYFFAEKKDGLFTFFTGLRGSIKDFFAGLINSDNNSGTNNISDTEDLLSTAAEPLSDADIIANKIKGALTIKPVANTKTVHIAYSNKNPAMAKLIANAIVQAYIDEILEIKLSNSNYSLQWMTAKANEERKKLEGSEIALQKYVRENDLVTVENKLAIYPQQLAEFSSQLSRAQTELKDYEALYTQIKRLGENYDNVEMIPLFADNKVLQGLREKLYQVEQKIKDLSKKYGPKHPVMINAKAERALLLKEKKFEVNRIIEATRNSYELTKSKEQNLTQLLAKTKKEMLNVNERFTQYSIMKREVDTSRVLYDALSASIKKASVTEQSHDINIWVVKKASLPGAPSKPQKKRNLLLGLILGLFGGIGLAFFIEYLDNSVKDGKELEQKFGLTVLGSVGEFKGQEGEHLDTWLPANLLSPMAESYRLIQSGLLLSTPDNPPRTLLITSLSPKEGKTTTTSNLAHILAQNGKKVLIIGCDMRRPRMHRVAAIPNTSGLSNYLTGGRTKELVKTIKENGVYLITAGTIPPNPAELLNSERMKTLVNEMAKRFDYVLLDSPPVQRVTDSLTLSKLVDGTLLVVRSGFTTYESIDSGLRKFREIHANILGVVVNGIKQQGRATSGYYGYYDYYQKDEIDIDTYKDK